MSKRNWQLFIEDLTESTGLIKEYTANMNSENFKNDRKNVVL